MRIERQEIIITVVVFLVVWYVLTGCDVNFLM